ncbi:MAG TPA: FAD-dependent oxidoreductase [Actinomycetota bacterium]|nr:FAD-dependent oxidoreductase [Actinomycetota bacterium]
MRSLRDTGPSLWMATSGSTSYPQLSASLQFDAAVIGGGITGITTALFLLREGLSVALLEADRIAAGTTGYTTAKLSSLHGLTYVSIAGKHGEDAARTYGEANEAAIELIAGLIESHGIECDFERMPAYTYTTDRGQVGEVEQEAKLAQRLGLPASLTTECGLPFQVAAAVRFDNQAMFHPRKYCLGLAEVFAAEGGRLFEETPALDISREAQGAVVRTSGGELRAKHVVEATQLPFYDTFGYFTSNIPSHSYGVAMPTNETPPPGMYLSADSPTRSLRPYEDGGRTYLVVGGEGHKVGRDKDSAQRYAALESWAREHFDVGAPAFLWSAHDYLPSDGVPYVGRLTPGDDRLWIATGFKKWGLTNGTAAARILADRITGRSNPWAQVFDSTRLKPKASAGKLVKRQWEIAERLDRNRVLPVSLAPADLPPSGEARVVKVRDHKVAVYRDPDNRVHAVSGECSHQGCEIAFNSGDRTWDCPCHGSRFSLGGEVLHGPAVRHLEKVELRLEEGPTPSKENRQ